VVAYDIAGNATGINTEVCTAALACEPRAKPGTSNCEPADECVPIVTPPEPESESSGCSTSHAPTWLVLFVSAALLPLRRRHRVSEIRGCHSRRSGA
jgi:MYXO-CTERM domain-containing protein